MRDALLKIATEYLSAKSFPAKNHPLAKFIRSGAGGKVAGALGNPALKVRGSSGQGTWADVPWIAVFDPIVTTNAKAGHYVVYLYSADMKRLYLSMNQGTERVREAFPRKAKAELQRRAKTMAAKVPEYSGIFSDAPIDLGSNAKLPSGYVAGHAFGKVYDTANLPTLTDLTNDLQKIVSLFLTITARGGTDSADDEEDDQEVADQKLKYEERLRYRQHRKIERNGALIKQVKKVQGYTCAACLFNFKETYGEIGKDFIEAHHLVPISQLPQDSKPSLSPKTDFAVLCSNCHRMVHRKKIPIPPNDLQKIPGVQKMRKVFSAKK